MKLRLSILSAVILATGAGAQFPQVESLPAVEELPDPWLFFDDSNRAVTLEDWEVRREEMKQLLEYYEYGQAFPIDYNTIGEVTSAASRFGGKAVFYDADLSMGPEHSVNGTLRYLIPSGGQGPYPVILYTKYRPGDSDLESVFMENVIDRGYMVAEWYVYEYDGDDNQAGPVQQAYPQYDGATLMAWSWAASAIITYLSSLDEVDTNRIIMVGNSRRGKTTLVTGAMDERIDLTVPSCSGCQGFPLFRFYGAGACHLSKPATQFPQWSNDRFKEFIDKETLLPFDQHFLGVLVAPRALLAVEGSTDENANQEGSQESYRALLHVYEWFDAVDRIGWYEHTGGHGFFEDDWYTMMDFADKVFEDKTPASGKVFDKLVYPPQDLHSWTAPNPVTVVKGCMDSTNSAYNPDANVHDPSACAPAGTGTPGFDNACRVVIEGSRLSVLTGNHALHTVRVYDVNGRMVFERKGSGRKQYRVTGLTPGMYTVRIKAGGLAFSKNLVITG